ncbi:Uncharacterized protein Adt_27429 [Abeliophyllum distichum]|uniref:DUF4216 domain-containing protein n=1 Tax=Abeliophyllum distichum TaxID=126358 RepID=A0ABD1RTT2_9LAMI
MSYTAYVVKGVRFLTYDRDTRRKTHNSGVSVPGTGGKVYYRQLQEILELQYGLRLSVYLFLCKWFRCDGRRMVTENNVTSIDINTEAFKDDQFILASQAQQVFYIEDPSRGPNWRASSNTAGQTSFINDDDVEDNTNAEYEEDEISSDINEDDIDDDEDHSFHDSESD